MIALDGALAAVARAESASHTHLQALEALLHELQSNGAPPVQKEKAANHRKTAKKNEMDGYRAG